MSIENAKMSLPCHLGSNTERKRKVWVKKLVPDALPARLKRERNGWISERVPLAVDGAERDAEVARVLLRQLGNVIGNLGMKQVVGIITSRNVNQPEWCNVKWDIMWSYDNTSSRSNTMSSEVNKSFGKPKTIVFIAQIWSSMNPLKYLITTDIVEFLIIFLYL